jgi:hypothetical protein
MSGRLTTAREARESGCSGSEIGAMRSVCEDGQFKHGIASFSVLVASLE